MDEAGLDQQEQDIRAMEKWASRNEPLSDTTKQEMHGCIFFESANKEQCGKLMESVENQLVLGTDNFPKTIAEAHKALDSHGQCQPKKKNDNENSTKKEEGVIFVHSQGNTQSTSQVQEFFVQEMWSQGTQ